MRSSKVLIVDNDPIFLRTTKRFLETHGYNVQTIGNPTQVFQLMSDQVFHCVLLDVKMPAMSGIDVLKAIRKENSSIPVIMISGESTINIAVEALKIGAYDFIEKPVESSRLLNTIQNAIDKFRLLEENQFFFRELQKNFQIIGVSSAIRWVLKMVRRAAEVESKVLITGESGTGKGLVARAIHYQSARKSKPFISTNCAAIPSELLESELFGHKKGTFTGAIKDQKGKFLAADGGTIFLDEIGDMDVNMQAKLLNVLQEKKIQVIGDPFPQAVDVRVIAATNKNIEKMIKKGTFREDLYYRLNVIHIHIPPLRERKEDILPLTYYFLQKYSKELNKPVLRVHRLVESVLKNHPWPGNVRELENTIERLVVFAENEEINMDDYLRINHINPEFWNKILDSEHFSYLNLHQALETFEYKYLSYMLEQNNWNVQRTARILGIDRSNMYKKFKKYGISLKRKK
ncbi:sigma-54-dependent transcriptional regulator [Calditrichota bacterium GD2]